nr:hypothetical protein BaRGS_028859 [Batillaria attramentaria]
MRAIHQSYTEEGQRTNSSNSPQSAENGRSGAISPDETSDTTPPERNFDNADPDGVSGESDDSEVWSQSSFAQFAKSRFQMKTTYTYCCAALPQPLLAKGDRADVLASLASWVLILRIMGDLPDRDTGDTLQVAGEQPPVISQVRTAFKAKYSKKDVEEAQAKYSELFKDPIGTDMHGVPFLPERCDSMLEKVQYVCCLGVYKPELRDELYCQLCKQLTNNPSRNSGVRGWFATCFTSFLHEGPPEFAQKVDRLLRRTCSVGTRGYPPSWLEFQASKNNKPLLVPVTFMNGYRTLCEVDAASTVQELVQNIAEKIGLLDSTGYSIYVTLHTKISCLGHGLHRVMDAISECEQHTKQMGMRESSSLWRLFFRREYFTPWHVLDDDHVNTDLIYQQVMRGVALGEYKCEKRFYIEHSADTKFEKLDMFVRSWLTEDALKKQDAAYYVEKVRESLQNNFLANRPSHESLKKDIVCFAKDKWFLLFSRFYDAPKVVGPGVALTKVVVALNNKGVYILDDTDTIRMHIAFWEVATVTKGRNFSTVRTLKGDDYMVTTQHADDFFVMLTSFMHGLRMRSQFAVVTQDTTDLDGGSGVTVMRGDLIFLNKPFSDTLDDSLLQGKCKRTAATCELSRDKLYVLTVTDEPTADMLGRVMMQLKKDPTTLMCGMDYKPHTLQLYSRQYFRSASESAVTKLLSKASFKRDRNESLWQFTRDPLKKPLLKRTYNREELRRPACRAFSAIQQYMKDLSVKQEVTDADLANEWILEPARRNKYLREEIFCQLIKQLTNNPDRASEERGWSLMTLLCAIAAPVGELFDQAIGFLRGVKHRQARACADLLTAQKTSGSRLFAPHVLEHEMVAKRQPNLRVQVMLPTGAPLTLEATSRTRISDFKREVKQRLRLKSAAEYSLFLSSRDSMHCLPDRAFYFDCLAQAETYWFRQRRNSTGGGGGGVDAAASPPTLVMLKKIWVSVTPGEDPEADKSFHFPQEVPNFLRGYHQCSPTQVVHLAALLYRIRFGSDAKHFAKFSEIAPSILPRGFPENQSLDEVKKAVEEDYRKSESLSQDEARSLFLREAITWPTYGSVFFEVKQRAIKTFPKYCLLAVNTSGVHISDLKTKEVLKTYEFTKIPNWAYDESSFTLIILGSNGAYKLLLETNVGHNVDDVLMSHITWVMNSQMKRKHGFYNNVGESFA